MNVIKDEIFTGAILDMTNKALAFIKTQVKEHTYLGPDGLFRTDPQYPEFCWTDSVSIVWLTARMKFWVLIFR